MASLQAEKSSSFLGVVSCGPSAEAWPIEIAWKTGDEPARVMLIKPAPHWQLSAWEKRFESQHQISLETLIREGQEPMEACLVLNASLGRQMVRTDMPETASLWLFKLYRAAAVEPNFRLIPSRRSPGGAAGGLVEAVDRAHFSDTARIRRASAIIADLERQDDFADAV